MSYPTRRLAQTAIEVQPIGFGAGPLGDPGVRNDAAASTVKAALDQGCNWFDTAPYYGIGRSERRLGLALAASERPFFINTKVGRRLEPEPVRLADNKTLSPGGGVRTPRDPRSALRVHFDYTYEGILNQHRDSLQRLGLPRIDALTIHDIDYGHHSWDQVDTAVAQLDRAGGRGAVALETLRDEGVIGAIGAGCNREMRNYTSWDDGDHEILIERLLDRVDLDFLILAGCYTLLDTIALRRVLPLCEAREVSVVIASPFAGGWLVAPQQRSYMYGDDGAPASVLERTRRLTELCTEHNVPLGAVALQFVLAHPQVTAVIPGARSAAEVTATQHFAAQPIPAELWQQIREHELVEPEAPLP